MLLHATLVVFGVLLLLGITAQALTNEAFDLAASEVSLTVCQLVHTVPLGGSPC